MGKRPSDYDLIAKDAIEGRISSGGANDFERVFKAHQLRSNRARGVDESMTKNVTSNPDVWMSDPARYDYMGVDTKKPNKKKRGNRA